MSKSLEQQLREGLIAPGTPFKINQTVEIQFTPEQSTQLQESFKQIKLSESTGTSDKRKLIVTVEGIHTGMTKNKTFYPGNTLEASVPTWTTPHYKPVLKNHNEYSEPLGRVIHAEYGESTLTDKYTVKMKLEVTDQDTIEKVLDGRYLTLSVGGSANKVTCSVCAKDLVTEGYCGHSRGRSYDGKEAYWMIGNYTGDEISFVNMPADVHAQVIHAELVTEKGDKGVGKNKEEFEPTQAQGQPVQTQEGKEPSVNTDPASMIDDITGINENNQQPAEPTTEPTEPATEPVQTQESGVNSDTDIEALKEQVATLTADLTKAQDDLKTAQATIESKDVEITTLTSNLAEAKQELESAEMECKKQVESNVTLARYARKTLIERVADLRMAQGEEGIDRKALLTEFDSTSSKVLEQTIEDLLAKVSVRQPASVPNPGLATGENNAPIVDDNGEEIVTKKQVESKPLPTLKQLESKMKDSMFRQN